jgi:tetratricopeptide (TPR) repeat protein
MADMARAARLSVQPINEIVQAGEDLMKPTTFALALALAAGSSGYAAPAIAQAKQAAPAAAPEARKFNLSKEERAAIAPYQAAVVAKDYAKAATLLPAAQAAAKGADAKYILANLQLQIASAGTDQAAQAAAVEAMIQSGGVAAADLPRLYRALGGLYTNLKQNDRATAAFQKLAELEPNSTDTVLMLAEARAKENKPAEAISLIERAISTAKASGQTVPENWYRRALKFAYEAKLPAQTMKISRDLISAYPTATHWRDALTIYRQQGNLDKATETDVLRLLRVTKGMQGDSDFLTLASNLNDAGLPGESKAVLDEGVQRKLIAPTKPYFSQLLSSTGGRVSADRTSLPSLETKAMAAANGKLALSTADAFYGYGDYAKAATLYRAALQKGGVDSNLANTRLGAALALAGQRAEAEAALKAVTGPRADLAAFWLLWLSQRS